VIERKRSGPKWDNQQSRGAQKLVMVSYTESG
jgi:hypothetical protein